MPVVAMVENTKVNELYVVLIDDYLKWEIRNWRLLMFWFNGSDAKFI